MDFHSFENLPDYMVLQIMEYLPISDLVTCAFYVCKRWEKLLSHPSLWEGKEYLAEGRSKEWETQRVIRLMPHLRKVVVGVSNEFRAWVTGKTLYIFSSQLNDTTIVEILKLKTVKEIWFPSRLLAKQKYLIMLKASENLKALAVTKSPLFGYCDQSFSVMTPEKWTKLFTQSTLRQLQSLILSNVGYFGNVSMLAVCECCPLLEELVVQNAHDLKVEGMQKLHMCPRLNLLDLKAATSLQDVSFLKFCPNVQTLVLNFCWSLEPSTYHHLLHLKKLQVLKMTHVNATAIPLVAMAERLSMLLVVDLEGAWDVNKTEVNQMLQIAPYISFVHSNF